MTKPQEPRLRPDRLFEVSWEVCNKVGGIHTVLATKALTAVREMGDEYMTIGPDIGREGGNPEFEEDAGLLSEWRQAVYASGIRIRVGRWKVAGSPLTVLVDFSSFFQTKDDILKYLWETYHVDSISGRWDYIEPVLFGFAAGKVIGSFVETFCSATDRPAAHFHEWMTAAGGLYLLKNSPYTATVFTTHATVMGRSIAGNGLPLYGRLTQYNADDEARRFDTVAKHSLEKTAARYSDCFCTVSDITAKECRYLLGKTPDIVTPNGFEDGFVWKGDEAVRRRAESRALMIRVAEACLGRRYAAEPLIVGTSGRYEFRNKGLDVFMDSLRMLAESYDGEREILAYVTVPAGNDGPRKDLAAYLAGEGAAIDPAQPRNLTHCLSDPQGDPVMRSMQGTRLLAPDSRVNVIFVPSYLQGDDGIFDRTYYELLAGMDVTVFASYYEPWGYTPLESVAFGVPTVTTTLAGFGLWAEGIPGRGPGVEVVRRTDDNASETAARIAESLEKFAGMEPGDYEAARRSAREISRTALWDNLFDSYREAYDMALRAVAGRTDKAVYGDAAPHTEQIAFVRQQLSGNAPTWRRLMIERALPERLRPLEALSRNLWWSWTLGAHELFESIDPELWNACGRNPIEFLDKLNYNRLRELEADETFLSKMDGVYSALQAYMGLKAEAAGPRIAYFSMEFGLHGSLKIYSGGLGILAGDYLKEASDKNVPMVGVGLLYRYGYFTQRLSSQGVQEAGYEAQNFYKLPISPARDEDGNWCTVHIAFPGRTVTARIWKCEVGRTDLYLLDTDHDLNLAEDRSITHYLYGGDWENRLKQELLLGVGGVRALDKLGVKADVFHCNEGHAAFMGLERINRLMSDARLSFGEALEAVRSSSLFTTHTPVPAGHDAFPESMLRQYMSHYPDRLGITWEQFVNLGKTEPGNPDEKFSMSYLAANLSQEVNGVSWLHGQVTRRILGRMWPGYFPDELHIGYVTNGVHFPTWAASNLRRLYARRFPEGFSGQNYDIPAWRKVHEIPDEELWAERMKLKERLINEVRSRFADPSQICFDSPRQMVSVRENMRPEVLTIGFARRFATYKRAYLLFTNLDRLDSIVNDSQRPVQFVFAGKAHPNDKPGQELIKRIVEVSAMPRFAGKVVFLQNYDMNLARRMVQGVDVWLNTPTRPQEASGTSGEKAVMNGVLQFSVMDGWWVEGYKKGAGWMLPMERAYDDQRFQDELDAEMIYRTLEDEIAPLYYDRGPDGIPHRWMAAVKSCISDIAANFTTNRMLSDYQSRFYGRLYERSRALAAGDYALARRIAAWKRRVSASWDRIKVVRTERIDMGRGAVVVGGTYRFSVTLDIDGLSPDDIGVELLLAEQIEQGRPVRIAEKKELAVAKAEGSEATYAVDATPSLTGSFDAALRVYPKNPLLPHRMDFALVRWV